MPNQIVSKIISGGQTGVDRAALDVAIYLGIEHGGWCPAGRRSESGKIPAVYQLTETAKRGYQIRTEQNVVQSDGTLILYHKEMSGGTALTWRLAERHRRPCIRFDLATDEPERSLQYREFVEWVKQKNIGVLNVAGPRESSCEGIGRLAESFLIVGLACEP